MRALHSKILQEYLVVGDDKESREAEDFFSSAPESEIYFVNNIVLYEIASYFGENVKFDKSDILTALRALVSNSQIRFENRDAVLDAIEAYEQGKKDFSEYLKISIDRSYYCTEIVVPDDVQLVSGAPTV